MRAQVSLIAIIGVLVILSGVGAYLIFAPTDTSTPSGFEDVEAALEQCVAEQMERFIPIAASHGGELAYAINVPQGTQRVVRDARGRDVPVWVSFEADCTSGDCISYTRPKLYPGDSDGGGLSLSIEQQFERALDNSVPSCFTERTQDLGVTSTLSSLTTQVTISGGLRVDSTARGSFSRDGRSASLVSSRTVIDSSFETLFDTANALSAIESETGFFAAYVKDVIALKAGIEGEYPPFYAYDFSYTPHIWTAQNVEDTLANDLDTYLPFVQLSTSDTPADASELPYLLRRGLLDLRAGSDPVGDSTFLSVERAARADVELNEGEMARGQTITPIVPLAGEILPVRQYRTSYDVAAPIVLTLTSRDDGLRFRFALEPRIDNNRVMRSGVSMFSGLGSDDESRRGLALARRSFCDDPTGARASLSLSGADPDETSIEFSCGSRTCTYPFSSTMTLPTCVGGEFTAHAPDVMFSAERIDSTPGSTLSASLDARERLELDFEVSLLETDPIKSSGQPVRLEPRTERGLGSDERAIITFEGIDTDHTTAVVIEGSEQVPMQIHRGVYTVSIQVMRDIDEVVIPARSECILFCLFGSTDIEEIVFTDALLLAQHTDLGPYYVDGDGTAIVLVPIFDLESIPRGQRVAEDVAFLDLFDDAIASMGDEPVVIP